MSAPLPVIDDQWVLRLRGPRNVVDPSRPYAHLVEPEFFEPGRVEDVGTIFLTNKECPYRCLMCDLWKNTTAARVPPGAVAGQVEWALSMMPPVRHVKLYNAGSFFDAQAISTADLARIAVLVGHHQTVIVESHPRLVAARCLDFANRLGGRLQVAMGLETIDPQVLPRLNKRMTLDDFQRAVCCLSGADIPVRAFILLRAPFQSEDEGVTWAMRSIEWAFAAGVECCVVIPTRAGNGAMEQLHAEGHFSPPSISSLEEVLQHGLRLRAGRVFADLWDLEKFATSPGDPDRIERLREMNLIQEIPPVPLRLDDMA